MTRSIAAAAFENPSAPIAATQSGEKITPPMLPPLYAMPSAAGTKKILWGKGRNAPHLPASHRRFGAATVTKAGALCLAAGVFGWATATTPWQLLAASVLSGTGWGPMSAAISGHAVAPTYDGLYTGSWQHPK
jgi:hypothetical protein